MKISTEFSKHAAGYDTLNTIQKQVVEKLLSSVKTKPQYILDLGCGSGTICKNIDWDYKMFLGVDFAQGMLELHPKAENTKAIYGDFNDKSFFTTLKMDTCDYLFSASALQWAENLEEVFENIQSLKVPIALAIFTSNTFKTLNKTASLKSFLKSSQEIQALQKNCFDADFSVEEYKMEFASVREMFQYIKRSGVSGSRKVLSFKETKQLMREYPLNYLEFEVAFITSHLK
jgi:malonyl-CoA O-methyltransferase